MTKNLRTYLEDIERADELIRVNREVDPDTQMGALAEESPKTVLFTNIKGHPGWTSCMQILRDWKQFSMVLDVPAENAVHELARRYNRAVGNPIKSEHVATGPIKEVIQVGDEVDITKLPAHIAQAGSSRFITLGIGVMRDPVTGVQNHAIHRMQVKGPNKTGYFVRGPHAHVWKIFKANEDMGKPTPISIFVGHHPLTYLGACWSPPFGTDEHDAASTVLGEPLQLVKCETNDLEVPADAELVLEGEIMPGEREEEGLFTEWTGTPRAGMGQNMVVKINAITRRKDAIFLSPQMTAGMQWADSPVRILNISIAAEVYRKVKDMYAGAVDVKDVFAVPNFSLVIIKMTPTSPGQARNILLGALTTSYLHIKTAITVNEDIDIRNPDDVWWAVSARVDPEKDVFVIPGCEMHAMDASVSVLGAPGTSDYRAIGGKMGIDASVVISDPKFQKLEKSRAPGWGKFHLADFLD